MPEKKKISLNHAKLSLNKEKIAQISKANMQSILGGDSTCRTFTCAWCGSGSEVHTVNTHSCEYNVYCLN